MKGMSEQGQTWGQIRFLRYLSSFCLEKLQGWRLNNISGKGAPLLDCPQGDFHPCYSQSEPFLFQFTCWEEPSSIFLQVSGWVVGTVLGHPEAFSPGWTSLGTTAPPDGTSAPDPSQLYSLKSITVSSVGTLKVDSVSTCAFMSTKQHPQNCEALNLLNSGLI